jgi:hypothetical protein
MLLALDGLVAHGEWMAASAVKLRCLSDPHLLHVMSPSFLTRMDLDCVAPTNR